MNIGGYVSAVTRKGDLWANCAIGHCVWQYVRSLKKDEQIMVGFTKFRHSRILRARIVLFMADV